MITWILIASGSAGKILQVKTKDDEIIAIKEFSHPKTAKKQIDDVTTKPGVLKHAIDYDKDIEKLERQRFSRELTEFLTQALSQQRYNTLILVAPPTMLGILRQETAELHRRVTVHELAKDLLPQHLSNVEMVEKIRADLDMPSL